MTRDASWRAGEELKRAKKALRAAQTLRDEKLYEDCVSRAYYAALHAAKAALATMGLDASSHEGVRRMFGLHLVKNGSIEKEFALIFTAEKEDLEIGDYDVGIAIEKERAIQRVAEAERFVKRIEKYLKATQNSK